MSNWALYALGILATLTLIGVMWELFRLLTSEPIDKASRIARLDIKFVEPEDYTHEWGTCLLKMSPRENEPDADWWEQDDREEE